MSFPRRLPPYVINNLQSPYDRGVYDGGNYRAYSWPQIVYSDAEIRAIGGTPANSALQSDAQENGEGPALAAGGLNLTKPTTQSGTVTVTPIAILPAVGGKVQRTYFSIQASLSNTDNILIGFDGPGLFELAPGMDLTPTNAWPQGSVWAAAVSGTQAYNIIQALAVKD